MRIIAIVVLTFLSHAPSASADWTLDNTKSRLSFVSTKAGEVGEVHRFGAMTGHLSGDGAFEIRVALDSVDTGIPIRDERMRDLLFETDENPEAVITARLDMTSITALEPGDQSDVVTEARLSLHGEEVPLTVKAAVARLDSATLLVTSAEPIVVNATQLGLLEGIDRLRDVAGLTSISPAVPVTFRLTLRRAEARVTVADPATPNPAN